MMNKRIDGLCFHCDEKFLFGHRCKDYTSHVLIKCHDGGDEEIGEEFTQEEQLHFKEKKS